MQPARCAAHPRFDVLRLGGTQVLDRDLSHLAALASNGIRVGSTDD
jgi:hypothetical protein